VRCTRKELRQLEHKIFHGTVPPTDLVPLRGRRQELSMTAQNDGNSHDDADNERTVEIRIIDASDDFVSNPPLNSVDATSNSNTSDLGNFSSRRSILPSNIYSASDDDYESIGSGVLGVGTTSASAAHSPLSSTSSLARNPEAGQGACHGNRRYKCTAEEEDMEAPSSPTMDLDQPPKDCTFEQGVETVAVGGRSTNNRKRNSTVNGAVSPKSPPQLTYHPNSTVWLPMTTSQSTSMFVMSSTVQSPRISHLRSEPTFTRPLPDVGNCACPSYKLPSPPGCGLGDRTSQLDEECGSSSAILLPELSSGITSRQLTQRVTRSYADTRYTTTGVVGVSSIHAPRPFHQGRSVIGTSSRKYDDEESMQSGGSSENELVVASSHLENRNVMGDNRCKVIENGEHDQNGDEGFEVRATVSLPIYEE
jgi:hypothetical protein